MKMRMNQKELDSRQEKSGRLLRFARLGWFGVLLLSAALYGLSIPVQAAVLRAPCNEAACQYGQMTSTNIAQLYRLGLSLDWWIIYNITLNTLFVLLFAAIAGIIFWRKSNDWMGLYVAYTLLLFGLSFSNPLILVAESYLVLAISLQILAIGASSLFTIFLFIFPNGQFVPRWTRWLVPLIVAREAANVLFPDALLPSLVLVVELALILYAQVHRYRNVSNFIERQQTKWFLFGLTIAILGFGGMTLAASLTGFGSNTDAIANIVGGTAIYLFVAMIPLAIGIAILHSRLWDIDILIRRTLIYALLTVLLAVVYLGIVVVLQQLFRALTGQGSDVAIIVSTLAIAALFIPLRNRVQRTIDHRFYRRKYDAGQVLASFAATVRDEVDLTRLTEELQSVVEDTMQPEHVSVWVRMDENPAREQSR